MHVLFQSRERLSDSEQGNRSTHLMTWARLVYFAIRFGQEDGSPRTVQIPTHYQHADT